MFTLHTPGCSHLRAHHIPHQTDHAAYKPHTELAKGAAPQIRSSWVAPQAERLPCNHVCSGSSHLQYLPLACPTWLCTGERAATRCALTTPCPAPATPTPSSLTRILLFLRFYLKNKLATEREKVNKAVDPPGLETDSWRLSWGPSREGCARGSPAPPPSAPLLDSCSVSQGCGR